MRIFKRGFPPRRVTLKRLLLRGLAVTAALTLIFGAWYKYRVMSEISDQAENELSRMLINAQRHINQYSAETGSGTLLRDLKSYLLINTSFNIDIFPPVRFINDGVYLTANSCEGNHAVSALVDKNDNCTVKNSRVLAAFLIPTGQEEDNGMYICPENIISSPELAQFVSDYNALSEGLDKDSCVEVILDSVYIDKSSHSFIPRSGFMTVTGLTDFGEPAFDPSSDKRVDISINAEGYELLEKKPITINNEFSSRTINFTDYFGEDEELFTALKSSLRFDDANFGWSDGSRFNDGESKVYTKSAPVYIEGEQYMLHFIITVDPTDPEIVSFIRRWVLIFCGAVSFLVLLWCLVKNKLNKTKYAYEDYQRSLTDSLAHDIKTPLMAISGSAENIKNSGLSQQEQDQYLQAILDNVAYTDSLISRTLYLNNMGEGRRLKKETIELRPLAEASLEKYRLMLDEKHISAKTEGDGSLTADKAALETITENLISNAVKYTPEGGEITLAIADKSLTVRNSTEEKIETKDLMKPFVRGDKARSNISGNGLGLTIAERAARINGLRLTVSSTDEGFTAAVKQR